MCLCCSLYIEISTHSLTRRLTIIGMEELSASSNFNSQPHKEADQNQESHPETTEYFNSQPHKEADFILTFRKNVILYFNSQPHKEADGEFGNHIHQQGNFNSQPHKEADTIGNR